MDFENKKSSKENDFFFLPRPVVVKKYPFSLPLPATLIAGVPHEEDDDIVQAALKRYSILVEFATIQHLIPPGIYLLPDINGTTAWYGVIFVRQGWHRGGIFQFHLEFPEDYPLSCPMIMFHSPIPVHPLVDQKTGIISTMGEFNNWSPTEYSALHVICFLKQLFYDKNTFFTNDTQYCLSPEIRQWFTDSPKTLSNALDTVIRSSVENAVNQSIKGQFFPSSGEKIINNDEDEQMGQRIINISKALRLFSSDTNITSPKDSFLQWFEEDFLPNQFDTNIKRLSVSSTMGQPQSMSELYTTNSNRLSQ